MEMSSLIYYFVVTEIIYVVYDLFLEKKKMKSPLGAERTCFNCAIYEDFLSDHELEKEGAADFLMCSQVFPLALKRLARARRTSVQ